MGADDGREDVGPGLVERLVDGGVLVEEGGQLRSLLRFVPCLGRVVISDARPDTSVASATPSETT